MSRITSMDDLVMHCINALFMNTLISCQSLTSTCFSFHQGLDNHFMNQFPESWASFMLCSFSWLHLSGAMQSDCSMAVCIMAWQVATVVEFTIIALCVMLGTAFFFFISGGWWIRPSVSNVCWPFPPLSSSLVCWQCRTVSQGQGLELGSVTFTAETMMA